MQASNTADTPRTNSPLDLVLPFLKLGILGFGGPAAHIALMEAEFVGRRRWLSRSEFLDYLAACNLIPGPNSTEMAIYLGYHRRGRAGAVLAGASFILPAFFTVLAIAWAYVEFGALPQVRGLLAGMKPVILAIILTAGLKLGRSAVTGPATAFLAAAIFGLALTSQVDQVILMLGAGAVLMLARRLRPALAALVPPIAFFGPVPGFELGSLELLARLGLVFLKVGGLLFGSGYLLVSFLHQELVQGTGWLTERQLLDAITIGQVTPGPVFTTATFIGYVLGVRYGVGLAGAVVATVAIFAPAFILVLLTAPWVPKLRRVKLLADFLSGVNAAVVALILAVVVQLAPTTLVAPVAAAVFIISAGLLLFTRVDPTLLIAVSGVAGLLAHGLG
jgi:chromate transporter